MVNIRAAHQPLGETRRPTKTENTEKSMTKQAMAEELDINNIVKRYNKTGVDRKSTRLNSSH